MRRLHIFIQSTLIALLRLYQRTLSPDHGWFRSRYPYGFCRFHPTCSEYSIQVISRYGILRGTGKSIIRIIRCNPLNSGGYDPITKIAKQHDRTV
ncbi:membrane protein insertion efficiency factor YidD [Patescibacteria group bacterium]